MKETVFIIGLGLIGGSLGKNIKQTYPDCRIIGYDIKENDVNLAKALGIIDESTSSIEAGAIEADFIILSTPVFQTKKIIQSLSQLPLKRDVLITDTGSTKTEIMKASTALKEQGFTFIGGHPMAGSHKSGVTAAKTLLFENAFYILVEDEGNDVAIQKIKKWLKGTKANVIVTSAKEHDYVTGIISHFPHLIAAALVRQAANESIEYPLAKRFAAGGFRDITRIASSNPYMWSEITFENKHVLLMLLEKWQNDMNRLVDIIKNNENESVFDFFKSAKEFRDELPQASKGAIPSYYDLYVDIPDIPGVISEITGYLAEERISLTNIRIVEAREDIYGVLVISFQNEQDRKNAYNCIKKRTAYDLYLI
ncbi:prephenate dehydrogenase [Bacillus spongiae]|uniref:Prephenate dehydrogenase n=1 Tax=Bacillus spongiae TaxID=2683610 RepID=A0ABU8HCY5_9BACI